MGMIYNKSTNRYEVKKTRLVRKNSLLKILGKMLKDKLNVLAVGEFKTEDGTISMYGVPPLPLPLHTQGIRSGYFLIENDSQHIASIDACTLLPTIEIECYGNTPDSTLINHRRFIKKYF